MKTLNSDKAEVLRRIASLRPAAGRRWGKMSCHQMVCHLSDGFLMPLGEKHASPASVPIPRGMLKWFALYVPVPWPQGAATPPEMEQGVGGTVPVEFSQDRKRLVEVIGRFTEVRVEGVKHPFFGKMSETDWTRWGYLHCDHHLRQFGV